ncbi:MAG TPA: 2-dehydropantoate 2-reductase [Anaerolineales bacterium]|nr:2-dehydropantoate 2-reductase [Anaerolineales bacterium]
MKFAIFGTGGVGGYFGGRLAQAGEDVTFIARGHHLSVIQQAGLSVDSIRGDFEVNPVKATDLTQSVGAADVVILAIKGWQLDEAILQMKPLIGDATVIVPLLNGIEHMEALVNAFGSEHVLGGVCRISAFIADAGHIKHVGIDPFIAFGELNREMSERVSKLYDVFKNISGVTVEASGNIELAMWEKYLLIAAFSGVGAVTRSPVGMFRSIPETRAMFRRALEEVVLVANSRGVGLTEKSVQAVMDRIDQTQPDTMASMQKDVLAGRPSELESQTGALVRMARAATVSVPTHEFIYASLLPMEKKARQLS